MITTPYTPTIGIPAKCLWRGFLILMYCDPLTIGTWGHPSPLRHADVLNGWSLICENTDIFWTHTLRPNVSNPRPRIDRNDDAFGVPLSGNIVPAVPVPQSIPVINTQIITATPNSPISSPLQNNYILQNNNIGPQLSSAPGGVINTPSQFSSSQNVSLIWKKYIE